jgi:hypothetical protein
MIRFKDVPTNTMVRLNSLCDNAVGLMRRPPKTQPQHSIRFIRHGHFERLTINAGTIVSAKVQGHWQPVEHKETV